MNRKKNIIIMYTIAILQGMVFYASVATLYRQVHGLTVFQISLIESISYLLCILLEIPWGIVADKIGYKRSMCLCSVMFFVSKIVFWRAEGFPGFLLERIILSAVIAGMSGLDSSILYLSCEEGESHKVFGIYDTLGIAGLLAASFVYSAFIGERYTAAAFLTVIGYGLAACLSFTLTEVKSPTAEHTTLASFREIFLRVLRDRSLVIFLVAVALLTQTHQTVTVFLNQLQYINCGMTVSGIGYVYTLATAIGMLGILSAAFTKKLGIKRMGVSMYAAAATACALLVITGNAAVSVCAVLLLQLINSLFQPFQTEQQNRQVKTANRATELSVYAIIIDTLSAGVSMVYGALANASLKAAFCFGMAVCCIGAAMFLQWEKKQGL